MYRNQNSLSSALNLESLLHVQESELTLISVVATGAEGEVVNMNMNLNMNLNLTLALTLTLILIL